ncbi:hypothetical protein V2J09_020042 [Rumex salicifolius]
MEPEISNGFGANFGLMQAFQFNENSFQPFPCLSSNSTSDEAEKQNSHVIDERKQRRMISNRESARRSRVRKQRQLDELWSLMKCLQNENKNLLNKLNQVSECNDRILKENAHLKGETFELHQKLSFNLEEFPAISDYFGDESISGVMTQMNSCLSIQ